MKFIVYLLTLFMVGTAVAQNPTILQGNYITNVFGQSNFVLNPNARTDVLNVTNATRSTTTPLVATSEFTLSLTSGTNATWTLRAFDQGMKGQNCEARFTYRGFATATTKAELVQNSLVVASLTLTPSTDPRIASINFPCGDLTNLTTFRIAQTTANMTGTNEIGGIYVGLATNQANVAQAETVVVANRATAQSLANAASTDFVYTTETLDVYNEYDTTTGIFTPKRSGNYAFTASMLFADSAWTAGNVYSMIVLKKAPTAANVCSTYAEIQATGNIYVQPTVSCTINVTVGEQYSIAVYHDRGSATNSFAVGHYNNLSISRFPTSSELVVTPERQNVWGGVVYTAQQGTVFSGVAAGTTRSSFQNATWNQPTLLKGKAALSTTNSGNVLGFSIPNLPVGQYKVEISGIIGASTSSSTTANASTKCNFYIKETTTSTDVARQSHQDYSYSTASTDETRDWPNSFGGVFNNTSVATRDFILEAMKFQDDTGNIGVCQAFSQTNASATLNTNITFLLTPLDQPSNSALYVQGPVKAAATGSDVTSDYQGYIAGTLRSATKGKTYSARSTTLITTSTGTTASINLNPGIYWCSANSTIGIGTAVTWYSDLAVDGTALTDSSYSSAMTTTTTWTNKTLTAPIIVTQQADVQLRESISAGTANSSYHELWCLKIN